MKEATRILDTPFYIYHENDRVWLAGMTPVGMLTDYITNEDWLDFLRIELSQTQQSKVPQIIKDFIEAHRDS
tara:strand:+ start:27202 stop:27417 length:216 start_codon:yes stop_codon:yes gene_type:complete